MYNAIENYINNRLTEEEIQTLGNLMELDYSSYESIEDFRDSFYPTLRDTLKEDSEYVANESLRYTLEEYIKYVNIYDKLFNNNKEVLQQLKEVLNEEEFTLVTSFLAIHTGENEIKLEDDCNFGKHYSSISSMLEMLQDMFLDELSQIEKKDLATAFWRNWTLVLSSAISKLKSYIHRL